MIYKVQLITELFIYFSIEIFYQISKKEVWNDSFITICLKPFFPLIIRMTIMMYTD